MNKGRGTKSNNKTLFQYNFHPEFSLSWFLAVPRSDVDWTNTHESWQILFSEFITVFLWQQKSTLFYFSCDTPVIYKILVIQAGVPLNTLFFTQNLSLICTFAYISLCVMADTVWMKLNAILGGDLITPEIFSKAHAALNGSWALPDSLDVLMVVWTEKQAHQTVGKVILNCLM